jgi:hypothetical protein
MPTLRQKVDNFCKDSGAKVDSDKLRNQVAMLKQEMKKMKDTFKHELHLAKAAAKTVKVKAAPKAKTQRVKMTEEEKGQRRRERAVAKELAIAQKRTAAPAEPMLPAPAPSLAPAAPKGGRTRRSRPNLKLRW